MEKSQEEDSQCLYLKTRCPLPCHWQQERGDPEWLMYSFKTKARLKAPTEEGLLCVSSKRTEITDTRPQWSSVRLGRPRHFLIGNQQSILSTQQSPMQSFTIQQREPTSKVIPGGHSSKFGVTDFPIANSMIPSFSFCGMSLTRTNYPVTKFSDLPERPFPKNVVV